MIRRIRPVALVLAAAAGATLAHATPAHAALPDCRTTGDRACLVRIVNADEGAATLYRYQFRNGRPTADVRLAVNQATEDDRYIREVHAPTSAGTWDCRWDGDDKCTGRLGGVRYVFPFVDGSPATPYVSTWQG